MKITIPCRIIFAVACGLASAACTMVPDGVSRAQIAFTAESYRWHRWTPSMQNILHGPDRDGVRVDTPDFTWRAGEQGSGWWVPGQKTIGVPYKWGGFDTVKSFERGLRRGLACGDVFSEGRRASLHGAVSRWAVGVDCSGFVSRCLGLKRHYSTRELAELCHPVEFGNLRTGDILNSFNNHVMLFSHWLDPQRDRMVVWQAGGDTGHKVEASVIVTARLQALGYQPLRYKRLVER